MRGCWAYGLAIYSLLRSTSISNAPALISHSIVGFLSQGAAPWLAAGTREPGWGKGPSLHLAGGLASTARPAVAHVLSSYNLT